MIFVYNRHTVPHRGRSRCQKVKIPALPVRPTEVLPLWFSFGSKLCLGSAPLLLPLLEKCAQKSKILIIFHLLFSIADGPGEAKGCQSFGAQVSSILSCDTVYDRLRVLSPSRLRPLLPVLRLTPPLKMCSRRL